MSVSSRLMLAALLGSAVGIGLWFQNGEPRSTRAAEPQGSAAGGPLEAPGRTQPAPGRSATIAPAVLHPVVKVLVLPGDRVKKDQALVKLDDDEPQADVRAKKAALAGLQASLARLKALPREQEQAEARAALDAARVIAQEAREVMSHLEPLQRQGAVPERSFHAAAMARDRTAAEERVAATRLEQLLKRPVALEVAEAEAKVAEAKAAVEAAEAELEHYTVTAAIDGVVSWLGVNPGAVPRPGVAVWGEILDLREIDVRCDLAPEQADRVTVGQAAEVRRNGKRDERWEGRVAYVGIAADQQTGRVPVLVRLTDAKERLRCYVPVEVRFLAE
jgi:multidrug resistance efflux pump